MSGAEDESIREITEAQEKLREGLSMLTEALNKLDGRRSYEAYTIAHLDKWINGGNPHDDSIPKIIEKLESGREFVTDEE